MDPMGSGGRMIDYLDRFGALVLANTIQTYWRERGYEVYTEVISNPGTPYADKPIYCIRSNLVNGVPVERMVRSA